MRRSRHLLSGHACHLGQLAHQVSLGVEAAGGVDEHRVVTAAARGAQAVGEHRGGIGALRPAMKRGAHAAGPDLELLGGGGAERVGRTQQRRAAFGLPRLRELRDGRRLADAVDADHEHHPGAGGERPNVRPAVHGLPDLFPQHRSHRLRPLRPELAAALAQHFHGVLDGGEAEVGGDEGLLDRLQVLGVERALAAREVHDVGVEDVPGPLEALAKPVEEGWRTAHSSRFIRACVGPRRWRPRATLAPEPRTRTR